ncbi:hypothetical protein BaRGS_00016015 [Batillaria attramentaria]|uniref:BAR domain-containing protein n=1 Tax=Batillaria attramentaria TaxID=370345 RepID=A0ABD0KZQ2_9CAEN
MAEAKRSGIVAKAQNGFLAQKQRARPTSPHTLSPSCPPPSHPTSSPPQSVAFVPVLDFSSYLWSFCRVNWLEAKPVVQEQAVQVLQTLGKADRSTDETFDDLVQKTEKQHDVAHHLQKEIKNYVHCMRALSHASRSLATALSQTYEEEWTEEASFKKGLESLDLLWEDYLQNVGTQVLESMNTYIASFPALRARIAKRGRKMVDFDNSRHNLEVLQAAKKKDEAKIAKAQEDLNESKRIYEELHNEMCTELPDFYNSRVTFYADLFQKLFSCERTLHSETSRISETLNQICQNLSKDYVQFVYQPKRPISKSLSDNSDEPQVTNGDSSPREPSSASASPANTPTTPSAVDRSQDGAAASDGDADHLYGNQDVVMAAAKVNGDVDKVNEVTFWQSQYQTHPLMATVPSVDWETRTWCHVLLPPPSIQSQPLPPLPNEAATSVSAPLLGSIANRKRKVDNATGDGHASPNSGSVYMHKSYQEEIDHALYEDTTAATGESLPCSPPPTYSSTFGITAEEPFEDVMLFGDGSASQTKPADTAKPDPAQKTAADSAGYMVSAGKLLSSSGGGHVIGCDELASNASAMSVPSDIERSQLRGTLVGSVKADAAITGSFSDISTRNSPSSVVGEVYEALSFSSQEDPQKHNTDDNTVASSQETAKFPSVLDILELGSGHSMEGILGEAPPSVFENLRMASDTNTEQTASPALSQASVEAGLGRVPHSGSAETTDEQAVQEKLLPSLNCRSMSIETSGSLPKSAQETSLVDQLLLNESGLSTFTFSPASRSISSSLEAFENVDVKEPLLLSTTPASSTGTVQNSADQSPLHSSAPSSVRLSRPLLPPPTAMDADLKGQTVPHESCPSTIAFSVTMPLPVPPKTSQGASEEDDEHVYESFQRVEEGPLLIPPTMSSDPSSDSENADETKDAAVTSADTFEPPLPSQDTERVSKVAENEVFLVEPYLKDDRKSTEQKVKDSGSGKGASRFFKFRTSSSSSKKGKTPCEKEVGKSLDSPKSQSKVQFSETKTANAGERRSEADATQETAESQSSLSKLENTSSKLPGQGKGEAKKRKGRSPERTSQVPVKSSKGQSPPVSPEKKPSSPKTSPQGRCSSAATQTPGWEKMESLRRREPAGNVKGSKSARSKSAGSKTASKGKKGSWKTLGGETVDLRSTCVEVGNQTDSQSSMEQSRLEDGERSLQTLGPSPSSREDMNRNFGGQSQEQIFLSLPFSSVSSQDDLDNACGDQRRTFLSLPFTMVNREVEPGMDDSQQMALQSVQHSTGDRPVFLTSPFRRVQEGGRSDPTLAHTVEQAFLGSPVSPPQGQQQVFLRSPFLLVGDPSDQPVFTGTGDVTFEASSMVVGSPCMIKSSAGNVAAKPPSPRKSVSFIGLKDKSEAVEHKIGDGQFVQHQPVDDASVARTSDTQETAHDAELETFLTDHQEPAERETAQETACVSSADQAGSASRAISGANTQMDSKNLSAPTDIAHQLWHSAWRKEGESVDRPCPETSGQAYSVICVEVEETRTSPQENFHANLEAGDHGTVSESEARDFEIDKPPSNQSVGVSGCRESIYVKMGFKNTGTDAHAKRDPASVAQHSNYVDMRDLRNLLDKQGLASSPAARADNTDTAAEQKASVDAVAELETAQIDSCEGAADKQEESAFELEEGSHQGPSKEPHLEPPIYSCQKTAPKEGGTVVKENPMNEKQPGVEISICKEPTCKEAVVSGDFSEHPTNEPGLGLEVSSCGEPACKDKDAVLEGTCHSPSNEPPPRLEINSFEEVANKEENAVVQEAWCQGTINEPGLEINSCRESQPAAQLLADETVEVTRSPDGSKQQLQVPCRNHTQENPLQCPIVGLTAETFPTSVPSEREKADSEQPGSVAGAREKELEESRNTDLGAAGGKLVQNDSSEIKETPSVDTTDAFRIEASEVSVDCFEISCDPCSLNVHNVADFDKETLEQNIVDLEPAHEIEALHSSSQKSLNSETQVTPSSSGDTAKTVLSVIVTESSSRSEQDAVSEENSFTSPSIISDGSSIDPAAADLQPASSDTSHLTSDSAIDSIQGDSALGSEGSQSCLQISSTNQSFTLAMAGSSGEEVLACDSAISSQWDAAFSSCCVDTSFEHLHDEATDRESEDRADVRSEKSGELQRDMPQAGFWVDDAVCGQEQDSSWEGDKGVGDMTVTSAIDAAFEHVVCPSVSECMTDSSDLLLVSPDTTAVFDNFADGGKLDPSLSSILEKNSDSGRGDPGAETSLLESLPETKSTRAEIGCPDPGIKQPVVTPRMMVDKELGEHTQLQSPDFMNDNSGAASRSLVQEEIKRPQQELQGVLAFNIKSDQNLDLLLKQMTDTVVTPLQSPIDTFPEQTGPDKRIEQNQIAEVANISSASGHEGHTEGADGGVRGAWQGLGDRQQGSGSGGLGAGPEVLQAPGLSKDKEMSLCAVAEDLAAASDAGNKDRAEPVTNNYYEEPHGTYQSPPSNKPVCEPPPDTLYQVEATHAYSGEDIDELSFDPGDIIYVVKFENEEEQDEGWQMGVKQKDGLKGVFPENFTRRL